MSASQNRRVLEILRTDNTFKMETLNRVGQVWCGKCFYCRTKLIVALDGEPLGDVTIEHILARSQGGDECLPNLALACKACNQEKGRRHDAKSKVNVGLLEAARAERTRRWRDA